MDDPQTAMQAAQAASGIAGNLQTIAPYLIGILMAIGSFIAKGILRDVKELRKAQTDGQLDLEKHKTDVANYKAEVAKTYVTQQELTTVHSRLDAMGAKIDDLGKTMGDKIDGIRNLLVAKAR